MSTWGGSGLADGMWQGIDAVLRDRQNKQAQANADRDFAFRQEQADRAQANAERQMGNQELAAERAQANADRDYDLKRRSADLDASLKSQDMELRGILGQLDASMKEEELADRREDRTFRRDTQKEQLAGQREDRALRRELGTAELEGKKEDRALRREEFKGRREDAAAERKFREGEAKRNQSNVEADRILREKEIVGRREDAAAERKFREGEAKRNQGNVEADRSLRREQFQATREDAAADRAIRERGLDIQESRDERADNFRDRQFNESVLQADREYKLKKEAQNWTNRINEQRVTEAKLNADKMRMSLEKEKQKSDAVKATGQKQIGQAVYNMLAWKDSGLLKKTTIYETQPDGSEKPMEVLAMPESSLREIFGTDGNLSSIINMYIVETNEGPRIGIQKCDEEGNSTSVLLDESGMYSALEKGFQDKEFATQTMRDFADKRDLGMYTAKEEARAMASAKATIASDPYGRKRRIDAAKALILNAETGEQRNLGLSILEQELGEGQVHSNRGEWVGADGKPMKAEDVKKLKDAGYEWDATTGRPKKRTRISIPGMGRYNAAQK